jgi:hypothetical protein
LDRDTEVAKLLLALPEDGEGSEAKLVRLWESLQIS